MSQSALGYLNRQYYCVLLRCARLNAAVMAGAMMVPAFAAQAESIVPDGRTQTQLSVTGAVTDISTQTIRGNNAFNSFSRFNVDAGNTVNLHLPGQTSNLLNLVHGEQSYINGLVNAYKGGRIGGNVYFFNPYGVIVGAQGVLNVGSLTIATPTGRFMNQLLDAQGAIDDSAVNQALAGQIPLSASGLISVKGRINALDAITLAGGNVEIDAGARILAGAQARVAFNDLVNVEGVASASNVQVDGGVIHIVAAEDITLAGQVSADGLGAKANGGAVKILAEGNATLQAGALISANAGVSGDGGAVEFSAKDTVYLTGGSLQASASNGVAGSVLIDPANLNISTDLLRSSSNSSSSGITWNAGSLTLQADKTLTIDNAVISTRNVAGTTRSDHISGTSVGNSGDLTLSAKTIEIKNGSQLLANADNGKTAGKISITAKDDASTPVFGSLDDSTASISIRNSIIKGGDISIKADANDKWVFVEGQDNSTVSGFFANIGISALDFIASLRVGANVTFSRAHATVEVDNGAQINASGKLDIEAVAKADASMKVISTVVGFGYGETDAQAKVNIGNATLSSAGDMTLKSQADSTLSVNVDTVNSGAFSNAASSASKYANFSFAVGIANQLAETTVASNATITHADHLSVEATGAKDHGVAASGGSFKDGIASAGITVGITDTTFTASLGGNVSANDVAVKATLEDGSTEFTAAAGTGGKPDLQEAITSAKPIDEILFEKLSDLMAKAPTTDQKSNSSSKLGLSAAFVWAENSNNIKAEVANNAHITSSADLNVLAKAQESISFATSAAVDQRELDTQLPGDPNAPSDKKKIAISASVAVINDQHHADALIGDGAVISSVGAINVNAQSSLDPFWSQWTTMIGKFKNMNWTSASAWYDLGGAVKDVIADPVHATTWSQTAVESDKLALAGALDFFTLDHKATARIGAASINTGTGAATEAQDINVVATASQGLLNLSGVPEFDPTSFSNNSSSGTAGFGGSYLQFNLSGGTDASIAKGATVRADDVIVLAQTSFDQVDVAETVGKAGKVSINGAFSLLRGDLHTIAQIGSGGTMTADNVLVKAKDDSLFINVAGGVARSQAVGIGFSVAINDIDREVKAIIGNRTGETGSGGTLTAAGDVLLDAQSSNALGAFTVAGSGPSSNEEDTGKTGGDGAKTNSADSGKQGKSGVGISAAASVNLVNDTTSASIANLATVTVSGTSGKNLAVDKDADGIADETVFLNQGLKAGAEDRALAIAGAGGLTVALDKTAGLAGAFTWNELVKDTRASLRDATFTVNNGGVRLDAKNTGAMWSISASAAGGEKVGIAGSVAYSNVDNVTETAIENAALDADSTVILEARDDSDIRSVAGAASYGGKAGIGAGVAISTVDSDTLARINGGSVNGDAGVSATATNENSIFSVAAALGASQGVAVSGSVTANIITNHTEASSTGALVTGSGNAVNLDADDISNILSIAGSVALSSGQASVGIAAAYNNIDNETTANATGGSLSGSAVRIEATEDAEIRTYAVAGSVSSKVTGAGSLGINTIGNITTASSTGTAITATGGTARIHASDTSEIQSLTGAASIGGNAAVGASGSYNHIGGAVKAEISGGLVTAADVLVDAERAGTLDVWAVSGSGAGTAGISGSIALNDAGGSTTARIGEAAEVSATNNALVTAEADDLIKSKAGALGLGGTLGAAGAIAFNDIHADTRAEVTGVNTKVSAQGNSGTAQVDNGVLGSSGTLAARQQKDNLRGVAVVASSTSQVENYALSAAGGGTAAVAGTVSIALMGGSTTSEVSNGAGLNTSFGNNEQEARVAAYHHDDLSSITGGGAIGGDAGLGGAVDTQVVSHTTTTKVDGATVLAQKNVALDAASSSEISQAVVAVGGGVYAGLAGTVGVVLINGTTQTLANNAHLNAKAGLKVEATSKTNVDIKAGALAVSGVAGVGITAAVTVVEQNTSALVSGTSQLNANNATTINAASSFDQTNYAYTAAAAGGVGIAGTVNVVVVKGSTDAEVGGGVTINADAAYGGAAQDVNVSASDKTKVTNKVGSLGIGLGGAGVGAVADVVLVHNGASASVDSGASITADNDITISANSVRDVSSISTAMAGGYTAGIAGAVSVISIGARPKGDAKDNTSGSVGKAGELASSSAVGDQMGSDSGTADSRNRANNASSGIHLSNDLNTAPAIPRQRPR
ncbi:MAG: leukotoxin LktA family filamentous adhesin [Methylophilaceae bacterium]